MYVVKLPSGTWQVQVTHNGARRRATAPTKREATLLGARLLLTSRDRCARVTDVNLNRDTLIALRERSGMNKAQLAEAAGVDRTLVTRIENGERTATDRVIVAFADALKVPVTALLGPDPAPATEAVEAVA